MKVLHLTLYRKWFDEIALGQKKREFREMKPYWDSRLCGRRYEEIWFRNGYNMNAPIMRLECLGIVVNIALNRYEIKLGKVLEIKNWRAPNNSCTGRLTAPVIPSVI